MQTAVNPPRSAWDQNNPVRLLGELSETHYRMYLLLLPSALLITAVVLYPTIYGMQMSFREMRLNLGATSLMTHAFLYQGNGKYKDWVLDYLDAWRERTPAMAASRQTISD